ncbi:hypothetical protein GCM10011369_19570 [Neiella marina]|uniref:Uncharacterized protein n=1 Tax=Neiella marina TaxID=508461 RepID=A0A8J2U594_9GAMM|nr:STAS/SEC14 domain-containing protein [Neiella marina]GGA77731.1 hypothetical protein GCM10011369_19570 [Neiella marina]
MKQHGSYQLELRDRTIIVRFTAAWNRETAESMCRDFLELAQTLAAKPWACLVDLRDWGLGGPEVMEPIFEVNHWCAANNQQFEAVVCSKQLQQFFIQQLHTALPNTESRFFETEAEALDWLNDKGFC